MNPKFSVKFETKKYVDGEYSQVVTHSLSVHPGSPSMECPHCQVYSVMQVKAIVKHYEWDGEPKVITSPIPMLFDLICSCPACLKSVFVQAEVEYREQEQSEAKEILIYPQSQNVGIPPEVPQQYREDYRQAKLVLDLSPKASAALSRRILQSILREKFEIVHRDLAKQIDEFIKLPDIPSNLSEAVDAIRNIGNFAAHPLKDTNTGEIIEVEPGEAEWLLEVLDALFDFAFVQPKKLEGRKKKLNEKLEAVGKPPMKGGG